MVNVFFDGTPYTVGQGRNLLESALDHGLDLPYFCWHPAMGSVGACRQCAVKVFKDERDHTGRIQMACMTAAIEGTRCSINDPDAVRFRQSVIEWLMINHPHDCPVCDEGGECHLQDMTVMTGHVYRRYRGRKRTYVNQNLGPFVTHEMNRCIQCYRCVRFYRDLAGGRDFNVFASRNRVYFGRYEDGVLESEFSGNLVEVCPTGVFTDKTLAHHYTRKWDLETAPSVCPHCGLGCNTFPGARYKTLRRVHSRYNGDVNGYFLCDRGRYGYDFVNGTRRIRHAASRDRGQVSMSAALQEAAERLRSARRVVGIGSGRASLESNYALRELVGEGNFSPGIPDPIHQAIRQALTVLKQGPARTPSLREVSSADVILLLAADPTNEAPMLDFSIRQAMNRAMLQVADQLKIPHWDDGAVREAAQGVRGILDILTITPVKLEEIAREVVHASPIDLLQRVTRIGESLQGVVMGGDEVHDPIAAALLQAKQPLVVVSAAAGAAMVRAAANLAWALHRTPGTNGWLSIVVPDCNSMGVTLLGGRPVSDVLDEIESGAADSLVVLENDLFQLVDPDRADRALSRLKNLVLLDCIESQTSALAHLRLPVSAYAESNGTYVNNEVRAQRFFQVFVPEGEQMESWAMLGTVARSLRPSAAPWKIYEDVTREISQQIPDLVGAINAAPSADWRVAQMKIAREHQRYSGRTAMSAQISVRDVPPPTDPETPFAFTMEGYQGRPPSALIPRFWAPGWNSVQSVTRFQEEVNGPLRGGNPGVRMIEPAEASPGPFEAEEVRPLGDGEFWLVPVWRIFGSEQLSNLSPSIQELIPKAGLGLNPEDAKALGVSDGELIEFDLGQQSRELPAKLDPALPRRVATVPVGYPEGRGRFSPGPVVLAPMTLRKME